MDIRNAGKLNLALFEEGKSAKFVRTAITDLTVTPHYDDLASFRSYPYRSAISTTTTGDWMR